MFNFSLDWKSTGILVGAAALFVLYFAKNSELIDPTNDKNIANQTFEKATLAVFGTDDPGGSFYDATHNEDGSVEFWAAPLWFLDKATGVPTNGIGF